MKIVDTGENKVWRILAASDPRQICERAGAVFDPAVGAYRMLSFGRPFSIHPGERRILANDPQGENLLKRDDYFFTFSLLWYLVKASTVRPTGALVRPADLPGGEIFLKGTHILPLDALAAKYATCPRAFRSAGAALGGRVVAYGDTALELLPLPKVPTTLILWTEDDEFPARANLLFDATCTMHLPLDILWSVAMMSVLPFLEHTAFCYP